MGAVRDTEFTWCLNVLTELGDAPRENGIDRVGHSLIERASHFVGHYGSVGRLSNGLELKRFGQHLVYRKE